MNVKRILCPIDFSDHSDAALQYASSLARESNATLFFVHVEEPHAMYAPGYGGYIPTPEDIRREAERLKTVKPIGENVAFEHHNLTGDAATEIVRFAHDHQIELIVMGTHGRRGVPRLLMGSVAEAVVRNARCPVMTVKQPAEELEKAT